MTTSTVPPDLAAAVLLDAKTVAALLNCSTRHVFRLVASGRLPPPVRVGALLRWPRAVLEKWIAEGCCRIRKRRSK